MSSLKQYMKAGDTSYAGMTLLDDELSEKHTADLPTQTHGTSPGGTRSLHLHDVDTNPPANDIAHGDDNSGTVEKKPSNLPTA